MRYPESDFAWNRISYMTVKAWAEWKNMRPMEEPAPNGRTSVQWKNQRPMEKIAQMEKTAQNEKRLAPACPEQEKGTPEGLTGLENVFRCA